MSDGDVKRQTHLEPFNLAVVEGVVDWDLVLAAVRLGQRQLDLLHVTEIETKRINHDLNNIRCRA